MNTPTERQIQEAAVEAGARALFEEMQELDQENAWDDPLPDEWREAWRDAARETLTAALPHLAAVPSATSEEVADAFYEQYLVTSMADGLILADALLDRFNITPRTDR